MSAAPVRIGTACVPRSVLRALAVCAVALLAVGCGGTRLAEWDARPGAYDRIDAAQAVELQQARAEVDAGDLVEARARLTALLEQVPRNLYVATALQDVELELLRTGGSIEELARALETSGRPTDGSPAVRLRRWYRLRADGESEPDAFALVLAARVEPDAPAALLLLENAVRADPECVWAHLGRAHFLLREGELEAGRAALDRAIELDPGHPRVRRLESTLLDRLGERDAARRSLATWLRETADDPRVPEGDLLDAELDLVTYDLEDDRAREALRRLDGMTIASPVRRGRALLLRSDALASLGRYEECLEVVREARFLGPGSYLADEHEARLLQDGLGDEVGALAAWRSVRELAATLAPTSGGAALAALRARAEIERLERALAERSGTPAADPGSDVGPLGGRP